MAHLDATAKRQTGLHMGGILDPAGSPARPASWGEAQVLTLYGAIWNSKPPSRHIRIASCW